MASTTLVAVTVIWVASFTVGATKLPSPAMEPADASHVTAELAVPRTIALNCSCAPGLRVVLVGEIATWICAVEEEAFWPELPELMEPQPNVAVKKAQMRARIANVGNAEAGVFRTLEQ